jgi:rubredoxin
MNLFKDATKFDHHAHKCSNCGLVFDHNPSACKTEDEYDYSHLCPACRTADQRHVYDGDEESRCRHSGIVTRFYAEDEHPVEDKMPLSPVVRAMRDRARVIQSLLGLLDSLPEMSSSVEQL